MSSATSEISPLYDTSEIGSSGVDLHTPSSRDILKREFIRAGCLITIGLDHIIIGPEAEARFQKLMQILKEREEKEAERSKGFKRPLIAWIMDAGEVIQETNRAHKELRQLQSCIRQLDQHTADWLAERAIFVVAHADKSWIQQSSFAEIFPLENYQPSNACEADGFFSSIREDENDEWRTADVITAFPRAKSMRETKFYRHDPPPGNGEWKEGPKATELRSNEEDRIRLVRTLCKSRRSDVKKGFNEKKLSKICNLGFAIFKLDEVKDIEIT